MIIGQDFKISSTISHVEALSSVKQGERKMKLKKTLCTSGSWFALFDGSHRLLADPGRSGTGSDANARLPT